MEYFRVKKERREYKGDRYFKVDYETDKVIQICLSGGEEGRKGRSKNLGIYMINKVSFFTNYLGLSYAEKSTKREFDRKFELACKILK